MSAGGRHQAIVHASHHASAEQDFKSEMINDIERLTFIGAQVLKTTAIVHFVIQITVDDHGDVPLGGQTGLICKGFGLLDNLRKGTGLQVFDGPRVQADCIAPILLCKGVLDFAFFAGASVASWEDYWNTTFVEADHAFRPQGESPLHLDHTSKSVNVIVRLILLTAAALRASAPLGVSSANPGTFLAPSVKVK